MIDNIDVAYCMAKLEDKIRQEWDSAKICREFCLEFCDDGIENPAYERIIERRSLMIYAFEIAFGVEYLTI